MTHPLTVEDIAKNARRPFSSEERKFIARALEYAREAHDGQLRKSGEPYVTHSFAVARILAGMGMDKETIAAGLLHDVPEDTDRTLEDVEKAFGNEVATLVDGITKLGRIRLRGSHEEYFLENLRKMFLAMAADIRVVIIKLADRLHNMRTLDALPKEKQDRIARETMEIFAQIANRLGISEIKGELEDLAFKYLEPDHYEEARAIERTHMKEGSAYLDEVMNTIRRQLGEDGIKILEIDGRTKRLYRLYQKLVQRDMDVRRVYDFIAIRLIVPEIVDCYEALGAIHKRYRPLVGRIKDYISLPKPNGYQSLHTTVFGPEGRIFEVQIRTPKMHDEAEYGVAAHWIYTERARHGDWTNFFFPKRGGMTKPKEVPWVSQLKEWQTEIGKDNREFSEGLRIEFFKNHIFAFTPQGDIIELPEDATPIDFAYAIHSEIGNHAVGARADGKMVPLDYRIRNGQVVEILVSKDRKHPNTDWLRFAKTSSAKSKIRRAARDHEAEYDSGKR